MQETIQLISHGRAKEVERLISSGEVKQSQEGISYLLIRVEDEDRTGTVV